MGQIQNILNQYSIEEVQEMYYNLTRKQIAEKLNVNYNSVGHILKACGCYDNSRIRKHRSQVVNENFFFEESSNKWYLIGYIVGDGSIRCREGYSKTLDISSRDISIISDIGKVINYTGQIGEYKGCYSIGFSSDKVCEYLISLGVLPNKSSMGGRIRVNEDYLSHYLRGLLDSDGTITYQHGDKSELILEWIGHKDHILQVYEFLIKLGFKPHLKTYNNLYRVSFYQQSEIERLGKYLYRDCELYLERKYKRIESMVKR